MYFYIKLLQNKAKQFLKNNILSLNILNAKLPDLCLIMLVRKSSQCLKLIGKPRNRTFMGGNLTFRNLDKLSALCKNACSLQQF